jgi:hypothetical protein
MGPCSPSARMVRPDYSALVQQAAPGHADPSPLGFSRSTLVPLIQSAGWPRHEPARRRGLLGTCRADDRQLLGSGVLPIGDPDRRACPGRRAERRLSPTPPGAALSRAPTTADYPRLACSGRRPKRRLAPTTADQATPAVDRSADYPRLAPTEPPRLPSRAPITPD